MKALKILVVSMGLVLVLGFGFLIWGLTGKPGSASHRPDLHDNIAHGNSQTFGEISIPMPAGAKIEQMQVDNGRIVVRVSGGAHDQVLVFDTATGAELGAFTFEPARP